jgi:hypothetical protein
MIGQQLVMHEEKAAEESSVAVALSLDGKERQNILRLVL